MLVLRTYVRMFAPTFEYYGFVFRLTFKLFISNFEELPKEKIWGIKFGFFSENFNFVPSHNKFIPNCGKLHKECYCFKKIFQNI